MAPLASTLPFVLGLPGGDLGSLVVALVVALLAVFVGKFVLNVASKLIVIAVIVVGALWLVSTFL
ncbi:hypothetical protein [Halarchaeum nitratireducens]|uniref:Uncharacterized protein n=1 Tax=Halarchaeum nitratireducens TaxID=489913 RepID=A0A830G878_9EURY|nr:MULTISPECIES: hypothetical protein [Halarchaeum]MBP2251376.1 nitrate/nitrite transporter NarK [Halarchaeum solikamskense]GGN07685.1 hypothetical protein GCM10009021_03640 [Halarchaeum nitratireducens]